MEDKMKSYLLKRIGQKLAEGKSDADIIEQLQAYDSRKHIEHLLAVVTSPVLKIV
jgi:hypothetical protein